MKFILSLIDSYCKVRESHMLISNNHVAMIEKMRNTDDRLIKQTCFQKAYHRLVHPDAIEILMNADDPLKTIYRYKMGCRYLDFSNNEFRLNKSLKALLIRKIIGAVYFVGIALLGFLLLIPGVLQNGSGALVPLLFLLLASPGATYAARITRAEALVDQFKY